MAGRICDSDSCSSRRRSGRPPRRRRQALAKGGPTSLRRRTPARHRALSKTVRRGAVGLEKAAAFDKTRGSAEWLEAIGARN
jgi:hypothetical protein